VRLDDGDRLLPSTRPGSGLVLISGQGGRGWHGTPVPTAHAARPVRGAIGARRLGADPISALASQQPATIQVAAEPQMG
jgi:hypothetical protein